MSIEDIPADTATVSDLVGQNFQLGCDTDCNGSEGNLEDLLFDDETDNFFEEEITHSSVKQQGKLERNSIPAAYSEALSLAQKNVPKNKPHQVANRPPVANQGANAWKHSHVKLQFNIPEKKPVNPAMNSITAGKAPATVAPGAPRGPLSGRALHDTGTLGKSVVSAFQAPRQVVLEKKVINQQGNMQVLNKATQGQTQPKIQQQQKLTLQQQQNKLQQKQPFQQKQNDQHSQQQQQQQQRLLNKIESFQSQLKQARNVFTVGDKMNGQRQTQEHGAVVPSVFSNAEHQYRLASMQALQQQQRQRQQLQQQIQQQQQQQQIQRQRQQVQQQMQQKQLQQQQQQFIHVPKKPTNIINMLPTAQPMYTSSFPSTNLVSGLNTSMSLPYQESATIDLGRYTQSLGMPGRTNIQPLAARSMSLPVPPVTSIQTVGVSPQQLGLQLLMQQQQSVQGMQQQQQQQQQQQPLQGIAPGYSLSQGPRPQGQNTVQPLQSNTSVRHSGAQRPQIQAPAANWASKTSVSSVALQPPQQQQPHQQLQQLGTVWNGAIYPSSAVNHVVNGNGLLTLSSQVPSMPSQYQAAATGLATSNYQGGNTSNNTGNGMKRTASNAWGQASQREPQKRMSLAPQALLAGPLSSPVSKSTYQAPQPTQMVNPDDYLIVALY